MQCQVASWSMRKLTKKEQEVKRGKTSVSAVFFKVHQNLGNSALDDEEKSTELIPSEEELMSR